ncbi:MAG: RHS repeat-associated core domain-containing protein [Bryobacterales bacterium]|nr:RHS repeat-associated core domain-containing protein [Bryobacterales bacterium]
MATRVIVWLKGSVRLVTDGSGNVVSRHDYLPFGEEIPAGVGGRTTGMGYVANPAVTQKFTGKERDAETGLDYFGARYLSGVLGRFTGADAPFADQHPEDPQSWNLYAYARNSPLKNVDIDGFAVADAGRIHVGKFTQAVYRSRSQVDLGVLLFIRNRPQFSSPRDLKQNKASIWFPPQDSGEGGCVLGCLGTATEEATGFNLDIRFSYDDTDKAVGARITASPDDTARFIGPNPPRSISQFSMIPGTPISGARVMSVQVDVTVLKGLTADQLTAFEKGIAGVPLAPVRSVLLGAIAAERKRREEEARSRQQCQGTQGPCSTTSR